MRQDKRLAHDTDPDLHPLPPGRWTMPEPPTAPIIPYAVVTEEDEAPARWSLPVRAAVAVMLLAGVVTALTILAADVRILILIWQP